MIKGKKWYKVWWIWLIIIFLIAMIVSMPTEETTTSNGSAQTEEKETTKEEQDSNSSANDTNQELGEKVSLKINKVDKSYVPQYNSEMDKDFVLINYTITNKEVESLSLNPFYLGLETDKSTYDNSSFVMDSSLSEMDTSDMKKGVSKTYDVVFSYAKGETPQKLTFNNYSVKAEVDLN